MMKLIGYGTLPLILRNDLALLWTRVGVPGRVHDDGLYPVTA
jgi:hypothetical protein